MTTSVIDLKRPFVPHLDSMAHRTGIEAIEQYAVPEEPEEIEGFMLVHPELLDPLVDAIATVKRLYGDDVELRLRLVRDPDSDFEEVFLVICCDRSLEAAFGLLDEFDRTWLLSQPDFVRRVLNVTIGSRCNSTGETSAG
jgi:hypothetical protein